MPKRQTQFVCQECGAAFPKWLGRCEQCGAWNSLSEESVASESSGAASWRTAASQAEPRRYEDVGLAGENRIGTGIPGFDTVLGGGVVRGSLVLVAGEPGAGKSTLLLQAAARVAAAEPVLLVSGEESEAQVRMRGERLGIPPGHLHVFSETSLERIINAYRKLQPALLVVDSVQTVYSARFTSAPGSVAQVREAAAQMLLLAKQSGAPIFLIGHVTKGGQIAGPKTMEHIVDAVIMLEGERFHSLRMLRARKNRFGPVSEMAVFEMGSRGLEELDNPSRLFLAERAEGAAGSAVTAAVEGTRPLLIEVQALLSPIAYGYGRRTSEGFDHNRLSLLLAVLERRGGLDVAMNDVYVNVVGGVRLDEPAADLAVAAAIASSLLDRPIPAGTVVVGELGLGGEVRSVSSAQLRLSETKALGMTDLYLPSRNADGLKAGGVELRPVGTLVQFLGELFHFETGGRRKPGRAV